MIHSRILALIIFTFSLLPQYAQNVDSSLIGRSPYDVADSLMFGWMPDYQHDSIPPYTGSSIFTTEYQPSGSYWDEDCDEESDEAAYTELVEYVRVASQLAYEELADLRRPSGEPASDALH